MVNWRSKKLGDLLLLANGLAILVLINLLSSFSFFRIDLTEEKRYSIKPATKQMLSELEDVVFIEVFLEGDLNAGFTRLQRSTREILDEFRVYSDNRVQFLFTDPATAMGQKAQGEFARDLAAKGIQALPVIETKDGERNEKIVFPGALVSYGGLETGVMLFKGNRAQNAQEVLNQSIEGLEYELANAIYSLGTVDRKSIGFVTGHGELDSLQTASFRSALDQLYDVQEVNLSESNTVSQDALVIAKPVRPFSELEKFRLDQYIMKGGKVIFCLDRFDASIDSASRPDYFAFPYQTGLEDQLFKYGVRINGDLVQDVVSAKYPVVTGMAGNQPQIMQMDWPFFPLANGDAGHTISRNLDRSWMRFASSMDTVKAVGISKTPLLLTSSNARTLSAPVRVSANDLRNLKPEDFASGPFVFGYLLEGSFTSLYKNRFVPEGAETTDLVPQGSNTQLVVISDGDFLRNDVNPRTGQPQQLGTDPFTRYTFANQDLLMNAVAYLLQDNGLIEARNKEVKIRPLDRARVKENRGYWQTINLVAPLVLLAAFGISRAFYRKQKFTRFS